MFNNIFVDQHKFDYSEPSDNEDNEILDPNVIINIDDEIIPYVYEFRDGYGSIFIVSYDWAPIHIIFPRDLDLVHEYHTLGHYTGSRASSSTYIPAIRVTCPLNSKYCK